MEVTITKENFEEEVLHSNIPVILDFWATWCGPCMMLSPIIEEIAKEYEGKIKVGKVNTDEQEELAEQFMVMAIPTLFLFKDGKVVKQLSGYRGKDEIIKGFEI
ncbi:MAG: thioredoxin [Erysipelotrichaceae bacterium]|nr:thioredoxin [Erysipelotrichaceae bacterium]